ASGNSNGTTLQFSPTLNFGFEDAALDPATDILYTMGNVGPMGDQQVRLCAINPDNSLRWVQDYRNNANLTNWRGRDLLLGNGRISVVGERLDMSGNLTNGIGYLQVNFNGNVTFSQVVNTSFQVSPQALTWAGADLMLLAYDQTGNRASLTTLDPAGTFPISRVYNNRSTLDPSLETFRAEGEKLISVGRVAPFSGPIFEVLTLDGDQAAGCLSEIEPLFQLFAEAANLVSTQELLLLPPVASQLGTQPAPWDAANLFFLPDLSCPADCDTPATEICGNQIDDDNDGLIDCDDPDLVNTCCCTDQPSIDLGPDTTVCSGFILSAGGSRSFGNYLWSTGATTDSIIIDTAGDYWLMVTDSCGNTAADTLSLHLRPRPSLDLGPDTMLCSNAVLPFLAQDGFAEYRWVDGSTEKLFTAFDPGTYWVEATDSCGRVQSDTVRVSIISNTEIDLGNDTTICLGDTLIFQLSGFTDYQWSQSSYLDCDDCPQVRFAPSQDTLLLVAAQYATNCFSSDSIRVRINIAAGSREVRTICAGDSLLFGDQQRWQTGQYVAAGNNGNCLVTDTLDLTVLEPLITSESQTICTGDSAIIFGQVERLPGLYQQEFVASTGCDSLHQIQLSVADPFFSTTTISLCPGDSIEVFGQFQQAPGSFSQTLVAANGCDSIRQMTLLLRDISFTREQLTICQGDSALIFGTFEQQAGTYERRFTGANTCDSTHQIILEVTELMVAVQELLPACGENAGAGQVIFNQQGGVLSVRWPDGSTDPVNNDLAPGNYDITVSDENDCLTVVSLTIGSSSLPAYNLTAFPESCPGENDGTIMVSEFAGARYQLAGGPEQTSGLFNNLSPGDYQLTIRDSLGCGEQVTVSIDGAATILLDLPESITLNFGDSITLTPQTNLINGTIGWSSTNGDSCSNCRTLTVRPPASTLVIATAEDENGCSASDQTNIIVSEENLFYVPTAFSPNGDGMNDQFQIYPGPAVVSILSLTIYDRWGNQAFLAATPDPSGIPISWDGRSVNGKMAGVGVYVYVTEVQLFTGEVVERAGEVMVVR
ncbi:MAG: gliding motility-associated C-terminal domain-containing protein, partial [Bacteroidota bacterium]